MALTTYRRCWRIAAIDFIELHSRPEIVLELRYKKITWTKVLSITEAIQHIHEYGLSTFHSLDIIHTRFFTDKYNIYLVERGWCGPSKTFCLDFIEYLKHHKRAAELITDYPALNRWTDKRVHMSSETLVYKAEKLIEYYEGRLERLNTRTAIFG